METCVVKLTKASEKYGNLNIRACGKDFFPDDVFGGHSKKTGIGAQIVLKAEGLTEPIKTDIPTDKATGRPRWFFRERKWLKEFLTSHSLVPGLVQGQAFCHVLFVSDLDRFKASTRSNWTYMRLIPVCLLCSTKFFHIWHLGCAGTVPLSSLEYWPKTLCSQPVN